MFLFVRKVFSSYFMLPARPPSGLFFGQAVGSHREYGTESLRQVNDREDFQDYRCRKTMCRNWSLRATSVAGLSVPEARNVRSGGRSQLGTMVAIGWHAERRELLDICEASSAKPVQTCR